MKMTRRTLQALAGVAILTAAASPALAHHSANAEFDTSKEVTMTGTLVEVQAIAPHSHWIFMIKNAQGAAEKWDVEGAAPTVLRRQGVQVKEQIKPGETYSFLALPGWSGHVAYLVGITIDGKDYRIQKL